MECLPEKTELIEVRENLEQARSLSDFLQILIKDLNYFSETNCGKITDHTLNETNIEEVMKFCENITNSLLKKSNKQDTVKLKVIIDKNVPKKILTDEWRLKQILINLLSNSVKFTIFGEIRLFICIENFDNLNYVKYLISDTGVGIRPDNFCKLFQPFNKDLNGNSKINEFGSGLGLSLCKDISEKLGPGLKFDSKEGEGSSFWFHTPLSSYTNNYEVDLQLTENKDELTLLLIEDKNYLTKFNFENKSCDGNFYNYSIKRSNTPNTIVYDQPLQRPNNSFCTPNTNEFNLSSQIENNMCKDNLMFIPSNETSSSKIYLEKSQNSKENIDEIFKLSKQSFIDLCLKHTNNIYSKGNCYKDFPFSSKNICDIIDIPVIHRPDKALTQKIKKIDLPIFNKNNILLNVIICDDEKLIRQAHSRTVKNVCKSLGINVNIIESEDGIETVYLFYKSIIQGTQISFIFSDENMNFFNGTKSSYLIREIRDKNRINVVPFYLVSSFDENYFVNNISYKDENITNILKKPINKNDLIKIIKAQETV